MLFASVTKKWNIKLTVIDQFTGQDEKIIGQLWEYLIPGHDEPDHYHFSPKYLPELEGMNIHADGNDDKRDLLESIKTSYQRKLKYCGLVSDRAKLLFSLLPVEQVF